MRKIFISLASLLLFLSSALYAQLNMSPQPSLMPRNTFGLDEELEKRFDMQLKHRLYKDVDVGIVVKRVLGPVLYQKNPKQLFIPASTVKIITAMSSLIKFDTHYRFYSMIRHDGEFKDKTIHGNVYIIGYGDPTLTDAKLRRSVHNIYEKGVRHIKGNIIYVTHYFDEEGPMSYPDARHYYTPPSALSINYNQVKLRLDSKNQLETVPSTSYAILNQDIAYRGKLRSKKRPSLMYKKTETGDNYHVKGELSDSDFDNRNMILAVTRPGLYAATRFKELLLEKKIQFEGSVQSGYVPRQTRFLDKILSNSLYQIIPMMQKQSNNMIASVLNKNLGASFISQPGTTEKGLQIIRQLCERRFKFEKGRYALVDASGLSYENRLSPMNMTNVLVEGYRNPYLQEIVMNSLPHVGKDIVIEGVKMPEHMDIFLKTGTLSSRGVNSLAGYIMDKVSGDIYTFVIFANRQKSGPLTLSGTLTTPLLKTIIDSIKS